MKALIAALAVLCVPLAVWATSFGTTFGGAGGGSGIQRMEWRFRTNNMGSPEVISGDCAVTDGTSAGYVCSDRFGSGGPPQTSGTADGLCDYDGSTAVQHYRECGGNISGPGYNNNYSRTGHVFLSDPVITRYGCMPTIPLTTTSKSWANATNSATAHIDFDLWAISRTDGNNRGLVGTISIDEDAEALTNLPPPIDVGDTISTATASVTAGADGILLWRIGYIELPDTLYYAEDCDGVGSPNACCTDVDTGNCVEPMFDVTCFVDMQVE